MGITYRFVDPSVVSGTPGAASLFYSNWESGPGTTDEIIRDESAPGGGWNTQRCAPLNGPLAVVANTGLGWSLTPNVLQCTLLGTSCGLVGLTDALERGQDFWVRAYIMVLDANSGLTNHPFKTGWRGSNSLILWSLQGKDFGAQTYTPAIRFDPTRWIDPNISQGFAVNFLGPALDYGTWYRFEWKVEWVGALEDDRSRPAEVRIYNMAGTQIAGTADYVHAETGTTLTKSLADGAYFQHEYIELDDPMTAWQQGSQPHVGYEGPNGSATTSERYFFAGYALSTQDWIGGL